MKRRIVSLALCLALVLGLLPATALAAGVTYTPFGDVPDVVVDGVTYYDLYGSAGERSDDINLIYEDALKSINPESGTALYQLWDKVAQAVYLDSETKIASSNISDTTYTARYWDLFGDWGSEHNNNPIYRDGNGRIWYSNHKQDQNNGYYTPEKFIHSDGLEMQISVENLATEIARNIESHYEGTISNSYARFDWNEYLSGGIDGLVDKLEAAGLEDGDGPFYYTTNHVVAEYDNQGVDDASQMMTWGAVFYDFSIDYLQVPTTSAINAIDVDGAGLSGDVELYDYVQSVGGTVPGITYEITTDEPVFSVGGINQSSQPVELTITYGTSASESATNTRSHTEEYNLSESVRTSVEFETKGAFTFVQGNVKWGVELGFEASQMWSDTWEDSTTYSNSTESTASSTVELPGHTQILMSTGKGNTTFSLDYDAPIAIRYKVLIFGNYFVVNEETAAADHEVWAETTRVLTTFGTAELATGDNAHAAGNLYNRYENANSPTYDTLYGTGLDMYGIKDNSWNRDGSAAYTVDLPTVVDQIGLCQPYSVTGGTLSASVKSTNTTIYGLEPLYPLEKVTSDKAFDYKLVVGDELYLDNIPLYGYNSANVAYYGFDPDKGDWRIVDENGNETTSDVVSVTVNPLTGYTTLKAIGAGTAYVQYFIDENAYKSAMSVGETENVAIDRIAIPITVTNEIFENGTIAVSGELVGYVGEELAIDTALTAQIKDAEGKYQDRAITWELQEIDGAEIIDNRIIFTKAGTYHVRAVCGNVKSHATDPWYEITALDAKELSEITVSADSPMMLYSDTLDLGLLEFGATALDQYGQTWADDTWKSNAEWVLDGEAVSGNVLTGLTAGDHTLTLNCNGVTSNEIVLRVVLNTPVVSGLTPADTTLPYTGGILEFTLTGENLVDGMTVKAVSGATTLTAATSGSNTVQTALIEFPANPSSNAMMTYEVTAGGHTASVIVSKAPATDESEELDLSAFKVQFKAISLTLTDNIAMNFKTQVTEPEGNTADYTVGTLFWTSEPSAYTILGNPDLQIEEGGANSDLYRMEDGSGYHVFSYDEIAAKEMNDTIYAVTYVKTGGRYIYSRPLSYSVVQYANAVLNGNYSDEFKTMAVDMLNYGAEAQIYFGYRTDALANAGLTAAQQALGTQGDVALVNSQQKYGTASDYVGFTSASLSLESYVSLNYKASVAPMSGYSVSDVTLLYSAAFTDEESWIADRDAGSLSQVAMSNNGVTWTGTVRDIVAKGLRDSFYTQVMVTYSNGTETVTEYSDILQFSVADFAYLAEQNGSEALRSLTQALMKYGDSAKAYFETLD